MAGRAVTSVQAWLTVALSGLAPEVAARLRAEYLGHAQDLLEAGEPVAAARGSAVVAAAVASPKRTACP